MPLASQMKPVIPLLTHDQFYDSAPDLHLLGGTGDL